jgi:GT2 family glycosyltransferase
MEIDVIILSLGKTEELKRVTIQAISSLVASESDTEIEFNPIVIESNLELKPYRYPFSKTYYLKEKFHYNKFMNYGFTKGKAEYVAFCNNDLIFTEHWASLMIYYMRKYNLVSASPWCNQSYGLKVVKDDVIIGNTAGTIMAGWCFMARRDFIEKIGGLDERVSFYCSDNIYCEQLKQAKVEHGLITRAVVNHIGNHPTMKSLDNATYQQLTVGETKKFNRLFNQNILGYGK